MDPLALLERRCLESQDPDDPEDRKASVPASPTVEADEAVSSSPKDATPQVVAEFTYPNREHRGVVTGDVHEKAPARPDTQRRRRSRSRERESHRKEEHKPAVKGVVSTDEKATVKRQHSNPAAYRLSPLDRMILRQEELLMRQSEKFLRSVKDRRDST
ncbi:hypothetical protein BgAZ_402140 [Babesia gibsoni]|uniref:Uncharacterized protein n=1 Tax=Babesia gibsoni TaxID=33632 RepID=A0AAD8LHB0_BABGI|nr:hypothetical protein BgAZ_402140 [Babesia gibsoni]